MKKGTCLDKLTRRTAVSPPQAGAAREDWKIIRYVSSSYASYNFLLLLVPCLKLLQPLFHMTNVLELRDRLWENSPTLVRFDITEPTSVDVVLAGLKTIADKTADAKASDAPLRIA